jgi:hypothetical protein
MAAAAAWHIAPGNRKLRERSLGLQVTATELLRRELVTGPDEARLFCMILLAQLDVRIQDRCERELTVKICSGHCGEYEIHLKASAALARQDHLNHRERAFIEQRLIW